MTLINKKFTTAFAAIFLLEIASLFAFLVPEFNILALSIIFVFILFLSLKNLEYGLWFSFAELIIGSKGHLFYGSFFGFVVSLRMAIWLAVLLAFFISISIVVYKKAIIKNESLKTFLKNTGEHIFKTKFLKLYFGLFFFVIFSLLIAFLKSNEFVNIFSDFNSWLFLFYVFPVYYVFYDNLNKIESLFSIALASFLWVFVKSFFLLYLFSHNILTLVPTIYLWIRKTGVGEITQMDSGFTRIFFQSHIYFIPLFFFFFFLFLDKWQKNKNRLNKEIIFYFLFSVMAFSVNLLTFSRSNWVGLIIGGFVVLVVFVYLKNYKKILYSLGSLVLIFVFSVFLITATIKFPFPDPEADFETSSLIAERAKQIREEAGVASRWALLRPLLEEAMNSPFLGAGFGKTVTYISSDPRVLETSPNGIYETFAFEWGWIDMWLKLGLFGLLFYFYFFFEHIKLIVKKIKSEKKYEIVTFTFFIGLVSIFAVNFFSPYFNHPLGFGFLIFSSILLED